MTRRSGLKVLALLFALPVFGGGLAYFWIQGVADQRWAAAQDRIRQLSAAHPPVVQPMPTTPLSKELQIHFVAAIKEAAQRKSRGLDAWKLVGSRETGHVADAVLEDAQEFLDRLHQGARECAAHPDEFPPGWRIDWDSDTVRFMLDCSILRARRSRAGKSPNDAAETLLDALQLGRFWNASGKDEDRDSALHPLGCVLNELRDILEQESLSRGQLQALARELEPLERAMWSPIDSADNLLARWAEQLVLLDLMQTGFLEGAPYRWRTVLPEHLMKAEAFEVAEQHVQQLRTADSHSAILAHRRRMSQLQEESKNPLVRNGLPFSSVEWTAIDRVAEIRVLRVAAHYRATGEILTLRDPFDGDLLHSRTESRMKFWSRDKNGVDDGGDGGTGGWGPIPMPRGPTPRPRKDLVIEVEHPKPE